MRDWSLTNEIYAALPNPTRKLPFRSRFGVIDVSMAVFFLVLLLGLRLQYRSIPIRAQPAAVSEPAFAIFCPLPRRSTKLGPPRRWVRYQELPLPSHQFCRANPTASLSQWRDCAGRYQGSQAYAEMHGTEGVNDPGKHTGFGS